MEAIKVGDRVVVESGCRALSIAKHAVAKVTTIEELGADYGHTVRVTLDFVRGGKKTLIARHRNRLSDPYTNLANPWRADQKIQVRRRPAPAPAPVVVEPQEACPACGGDAELLGTLGALAHYRCRGCGMNSSSSV
jgi:hypothetical protein